MFLDDFYNKKNIAEGFGDMVSNVATKVGDTLANALPKEMQPFNNDTAAKTYASFRPAKNPVKENTGVTKHNDYDRWSDEVSAAGGEVHPQKDRVRMVAQSWDGDTMGEFDLKTNQGWINGQQGVAEDTTPDDEKAIELFAQIVADDTGYDVERINYYTYDEGLRTPSGIPVYYYSFDGDVRYVGALPGGKPTAIVNQDGEVGSRGSYIELSIGGQVEYVIKGKTLFSAADQQKIANAKPGDDEYSLVMIALDLMWGRMQHKFMEQDLAEGMAPSKRARLDDLIDQYRTATDPEAYYGLDGEYGDPDEIIAQIRQEFGDNVATKVDAGADKMHFGREHRSFSHDPYDWKKSPRVTRSGKINKQDSDAMKRSIKSNLGVAEGEGDPKFDKMLKGITGKRQVAKQQKADTKQQARDAFGGMFGGGNPADSLGIRKKSVDEGSELPPNVIDMIKKIAQSSAAPDHKKAMINALIAKYSNSDVAETYGAELHTKHKRNRFKQIKKIKQQQEKALGLSEAGCTMTEEGRTCPVHGMNECPGYEMTETSAQDKLHQRHQEIRKKSGLPHPDHYLKMMKQKQAEIDALKAEIESDKSKGLGEARKPDYNFDIEDIKKLERIRDLPTLKTLAFELISKPSAKPMKPEKVEWFRSALERMDSPLKVIKLMYDLMLSGEGHQVIGSRNSMKANSYRGRFSEQEDISEDVERYVEALGRAGYDLQEEKVRLDPKCWKGKKIGNPKTKVKGGVRVNNCVPK
jgi:hypothetical protein